MGAATIFTGLDSYTGGATYLCGAFGVSLTGSGYFSGTAYFGFSLTGSALFAHSGFTSGSTFLISIGALGVGALTGVATFAFSPCFGCIFYFGVF